MMPKLAQQLGVATARKVGLDARLQRGRPLLLQPRDLHRRERQRHKIRKRRPPP
jgi:hypothetical protein